MTDTKKPMFKATTNHTFDVIVIGGGAAGFFTAINIGLLQPNLQIAILERGKKLLSKVKISGGGRCNVTNALNIPNELSQNYPRGKRELLGAFHKFTSTDMVNWLTNQGVKLKTEEDNRIFPTSNDSQTIIDCFLNLTKKLNIQVITGEYTESINKSNNIWQLNTKNNHWVCTDLVIATGSLEKSWQMIKKLNHTISSPVPSLFTFNIKDKNITELMGTSVQKVSVEIPQIKLKESGTLLFTHWGFSGPVILKLSAWGALDLHKKNYQFKIKVNWLNDVKNMDAYHMLLEKKTIWAKKSVGTIPLIDFTQRFWKYILELSQIETDKKWADLSKKELQKIATQLTECIYEVNGKSTFKEEFVTAGGVHLKEINFKTMESKIHPNLYFTGEVLNIDAITGGFNFQNAWTTGFIAAQTIHQKHTK